MRHNDHTTATASTVTIAVVGSMTAALQAQRALSRAAIRTEIVKSDTEYGRGCGYGVAYPTMQAENVQTILRAARIYVKRYTDPSWR